MVIPAEEADDIDFSLATTTTTTRYFAMEVLPQRSRAMTWASFHNFSSTPCFNLRWGTQKQLRCVKNPESTNPVFNPHFRKRRSSSPSPSSSSDDDGGITAMREKHSAAADTAAPPPWNLRKRRAVCDRKPSFSPVKSSDMKSPTKNGHGDDNKEDKGKRAKFAVSLSKREIEADFLALTGVRPARRPKKRAKFVQRQIDGLFPGLWLTEITADIYKVNERLPEEGKK